MKEFIRKYKKGFTLVELIVVIVIIAVLSVVMIPTLTKYIDKAKHSKDLQQAEMLNTYLENNMLLFYDMEINSREDVIKLLKADDPNKELNLTVETKGYHLWFDRKNIKILLETYENLEKLAYPEMATLGAKNNIRSCPSEFLEGYFYLSEGDSSLYKVLETIEDLKSKVENSYDEKAKNLTNVLNNVKKDGFLKAYEGYIEYFKNNVIPITNTTIVLKIALNEQGNVVITSEDLSDVKSFTINTDRVKKEYNAKDVLDISNLVVKATFKDNTSRVLKSNEYTVRVKTYDGKLHYSEDGKNIVEVICNDIVQTYEVLVNQLELNANDFDLKKSAAYDDQNNLLSEIYSNYTTGYTFEVLQDDVVITKLANIGVYTLNIRVIPEDKDYKVLTISNFIFEITKADLIVYVDDIKLLTDDTLPSIENLTFNSDKFTKDELKALLLLGGANVNGEYNLSVPGIYTIKIEGITATHYNIICNDIKLIVEDRNLTFVPVLEITGKTGQEFDSNNKYTYTFEENVICKFNGYFTYANGNKKDEAVPMFTCNEGALTDIKDAGVYKIKVVLQSGGGNYTYSDEEFIIVVNKATFTEEMFTLNEYYYNGENVSPTMTIKPEYISIKNSDITESNLDININNDKGTIKYTVKDTCLNYTGTVTKEFEIKYNYTTIKYTDGETYLYSKDFRQYADEITILSKSEISSKSEFNKTHYAVSSIKEEGYDFGQKLNYKADGYTFTIEYTPIKYTIEYDLNGGNLGEGKVNLSKYTIKTESTLLHKPTKEGYTFVGWKEGTNEPVLDLFINGDGFTCENKKYTAVFEVNKYSISFEVNGGSEVTAIQGNYGASIVKPTDPTKTGYQFVGWYTDSQLNGEAYTFTTMPINGITLYAKWTPITYSITYKFMLDISTEINATVTNSNATSYTVESQLSLAVPTTRGYTFETWYIDANLTKSINSINVGTTGDLILYGKFHTQSVSKVELATRPNKTTYEAYDLFDLTGATFKVTYDNGTNETVSGDYTIKYVNGDSLLAGNTSVTVTVLGKDVVIDGLTVNKRKITVTTSNISVIYGETFDSSKVTYTYTNNIKNEDFKNNLTATLNKAINGVGTYEIIVTSADHEQYSFETPKATFTVTQKSIEGFDFGTVGEQLVDYDLSESKPCKPTPTNMPNGITSNDIVVTYKNNTALGEATMVITGKGNYNGVVEIKFIIKAKTYNISYDYDGGALESQVSNPTSYIFTLGSITLNKPTKTGYTFVGWNVNGVDKGENYSIDKITSDLEIKAIWRINQYTITFETNGGSSMSPIKQNYNTAISLTTEPQKPGYKFLGWDKEVPSTMPAENIILTANWELVTYTITYDLDGGTLVSNQTTYTILSSDINLLGEQATKEGFIFNGWEKDGVFMDKIPSGSYGNITFKATWVALPSQDNNSLIAIASAFNEESYRQSVISSNVYKSLTLSYNDKNTLSEQGTNLVKANIETRAGLLKTGYPVGFIVIGIQSNSSYEIVIEDSTIYINILRLIDSNAGLLESLGKYIDNNFYITSKEGTAINSIVDIITKRDYGVFISPSWSYSKDYLGSLLPGKDQTAGSPPDESELWANPFASRIYTLDFSVSGTNAQYNGLKIVIRQSETSVNNAKELLYNDKYNISITQINEHIQYTVTKESNYKKVDIKILNTNSGFFNTKGKIATTLGGSGLKTMMIGHGDSVMEKLGGSNASIDGANSATPSSLYYQSKKMGSISSDDTGAALSVLSEFTSLIKKMTGKSVNATSNWVDLAGAAGYAKYYCIDRTTGVCYTDIYYYNFHK